MLKGVDEFVIMAADRLFSVNQVGCIIINWCGVAGETVRDDDRVLQQRLHLGTSHVDGFHGTELVATDALPPGDQRRNSSQGSATGKNTFLLVLLGSSSQHILSR